MVTMRERSRLTCTAPLARGESRGMQASTLAYLGLPWPPLFLTNWRPSATNTVGHLLYTYHQQKDNATRSSPALPCTSVCVIL